MRRCALTEESAAFSGISAILEGCLRIECGQATPRLPVSPPPTAITRLGLHQPHIAWVKPGPHPAALVAREVRYCTGYRRVCGDAESIRRHNTVALSSVHNFAVNAIPCFMYSRSAPPAHLPVRTGVARGGFRAAVRDAPRGALTQLVGHPPRVGEGLIHHAARWRERALWGWLCNASLALHVAGCFTCYWPGRSLAKDSRQSFSEWLPVRRLLLRR